MTNPNRIMYKQKRSAKFLFFLVAAAVSLISAGVFLKTPQAHAATTGIAVVPIVADNFNDNAGGNTGFAGNDGMNNWSADWSELGETDGATNGDVVVSDSNNGRLRIRDASNGARRTADLSALTSADLIIEYRISTSNPLETTDYVTIEYHNGSNWQEIGRIIGTGSGSSSYTRMSMSIPSLSASTQIRIVTSANMDDNDSIYFRYVSIMHQDSSRNYCYLVADGHNNDSGDSDLLTIVEQPTGKEAPIGSGTGTDKIETIAFQPGVTTLYAVDEGDFGTIDLETGVFTSIGSVGTGTGGLGQITFDDVDSLAFDPFSGILYGVHRRRGTPNPDDILLQIDPATGSYVDDAFGANTDYVAIPAGSTANWADIDDIAVSSYDGRLFAIANASGSGDELVLIDKTQGTITSVGSLGVDDMEGLSFDVEGHLFGTTGTGSAGAQTNSLYDIAMTGTASNQRPLTAGIDYESAACLTWGTNDITGTVYHDSNVNRTLDSGETGTSGVTVRLYRDVNGDGHLDAGDVLLAEVVTDANGEYAFGLPGGIGALGDFVIDIDTGDLPTDHFLTTDNEEVAAFADTGNTDPNNDYGHSALVDMGDLPSSYDNTLIDDDGPRHQIGSLVLGTGVTSEPDGQENANADGDTDDGVTRMPGVANPGHGGWTIGTVGSGNGGSLQITISGGSGIPQLFMDFNEDGTLTEVTLRDASGTPITGAQSGTIRVYFDVPTGTFNNSSNPIFTRVRLSSAGGLNATGYASDGEVEDYVWRFGPTAVTLQSVQAISSAPLYVPGITAVIAALFLVLTGALFMQHKRGRIPTHERRQSGN
jgi:hypothetical protein